MGVVLAQQNQMDPEQFSDESVQRPPIIPSHEPVEKALENKPIPISIQIQGARVDDRIVLNFREKGRFEFNSMIMGYDNNSRDFRCTIEENFHSNETFEYYIEIFPKGASKIRLPAEKNVFFEIKSYKSSAQIIRGILIFLLIISPAIIAYIVSRVQKSHHKRTTLYQQKLRRRKRDLTRQREKHYKEYLKKLSGNRGSVQPSKPAASTQKPSGQTHDSSPRATPEIPPAVTDLDSPKLDDKVSTQELKRELDGILSRKTPESPPRRPIPGNKSSMRHTKQPTRRQPRKPHVPVRKQPVKKPPETPSGRSMEDLLEKTGPIPAPESLPSSDQDASQKSLDKNERDRLLDILGLDDV
jgi:hypothetical protein